MEEKLKREEAPEHDEGSYEILSWANEGEDITIRDDQYDFPWVLDAVRRCRKRGFRFRLVDSGKFDISQLEWLGKAGADFYTSDGSRPSVFELELMNKACRRGRAFVAYFHYGPLEAEESGEETDSIFFSELMKLGESGVYIHLSNREKKRNISQLNPLASACKRGGSWLVYYHHGPLEASLEELGRDGAWIHLSDKSLQEDENLTLFSEIIKSTRVAGTNLVLHLEKGLDFLLLREIIRKGAYVLFKFSLFDRKSPFRLLEKETKKRKLDFRAFYLYTHFSL